MTSAVCRRSTATAIAFLFLSIQAIAATKTWTPFLGSDDWQNGANWSPNGEPGSADDVVIDVANDLVVLNADTALVDDLLLENGADIRTNGFTLNVNDTGNNGFVTIGNGVNLSRLEIDTATGKSADVDLLLVEDGGQLDMDGGLIEVDSQLVLGEGGEIFGRGRIELAGTTAPSSLSLGRVVVTPATTLAIVSTGGRELILGDSHIILQRGAILDIDANTTVSSGSIALADAATLDISTPWESQGSFSVEGSGNIETTEAFLSGGAVTMSGSLDLLDSAGLTMNVPATFTSASSVTLDVHSVLALHQPSRFEGGSIDGPGTLAATAAVTIAEDTLIDIDKVMFAEFATPNEVVIEPGRTLTLDVLEHQGSAQSSIDSFVTYRVNSGSTLNVVRPWANQGTLELKDSARVSGGHLEARGGLRVESGEAVIDAPLTLRSVFLGDGDLRLEGETTYGNVFSANKITQNGDASVTSNAVINPELWAIAGSNNAQATVELGSEVTTGLMTLAAGENSTAMLRVNHGWQSGEATYVGGTETGGVGTATVEIHGTPPNVSSEPVELEGPLRVYAGSTVRLVNNAEVFVRTPTFDAGSTLEIVDGAFNVDGGIAAFSDSSYGFGSDPGPTNSQLPQFNVVNGGLAPVAARFSIGDSANTIARTEVVGLNGVNSPSTLRSTGGGSTADLRVGNEGHGQLLIADGGLVEFQDDIIIGRLTGSLGTAVVDGVNNGVRSTMNATSTGSIIVVGSLGTGTLDITDGARVASDRNVFIAQTPDSVGQIHLFQTNEPNNGGFDSELFVGDDLVVGGGTSSGGAGTLIVGEGSRVDVVEAMLLRSEQSRVTVEGGELSVARLEHTSGGALQLHSGRLDIEAINTDQSVTIGDGTSFSPMQLTIIDSAETATFGMVGVESNGIFQVEGHATVNSLALLNGSKLTIGGRLELNSLQNGTADIEFIDGTLAIADLTPATISHAMTVSGSATFEATGFGGFPTVAGSITGDGIGSPDRVIKTGGGQLTLTGANAFDGPLVVTAGKVTGNTDSIPGDVQNAGQVVFDQSSDGVYNGLISGGGVLEKRGDAALILGQANTYTGDTMVHNGLLLVENTAGSATGAGDVFVFDGGTLGGAGAVGNVFASAGSRVAPGTSLGILSVQSLDLTGGGAVTVDLAGIAAGTEHDQLQVDQSVILNGGTLEIDLADGYVTSFGDTFALIEAGGGVVGTFASLTGDSPAAGLAFDVIYDSNSVLLQVVAPSTFTADFDNDGDVDGADLAQWQGDYGVNANSDADADGDSDGLDLLRWQRQFGSGIPTTAASHNTPEPTAWWLACSFVAAITMRRGRTLR